MHKYKGIPQNSGALGPRLLGWLLTLEHDQAGQAQVERLHVKLTVDVTFGQR